MHVLVVIAFLLRGALVAPSFPPPGTCQFETPSVPSGTLPIALAVGFAPLSPITITQTWTPDSGVAGPSPSPRISTRRLTSDANGTFQFHIPSPSEGSSGLYTWHVSGGSCDVTFSLQGTQLGTIPATPPPTDTAAVDPGTSIPLAPAIPVVLGAILLATAWVVRRLPRSSSGPFALAATLRRPPQD